MTYDEYFVELQGYFIDNISHLRWGQAAYIILHRHFPEVATKITGTKLDPFESENLSEDFYKLIYNLTDGTDD